MSEVDGSEDLPNGDDSAFGTEVCEAETDEHADHIDGHDPEVHGHVEHECQEDDGTSSMGAGVTPDQVYVATAQGFVTADVLHEAAGIKTTHIVIHDQTLDGLKTPTTPLPPPTPATPLSRERGFRYQWDDSVLSSVLPVRCKTSNGEMYKDRFGSGGRGRCIRMGEKWYTPSEFEAICGRQSSKDWKRSIRYGGRTLQCLIEDGILHPHATSCTCAACCDDESVTGPVRLFQPYKRRKKESTSEMIVKKKASSPISKSPVGLTNSPSKDAVVVALKNGGILQPIRVSESGETIQIITAAEVGGTISVTGVEPAMMMPVQTQVIEQPQKSPVSVTQASTLDVNEQKMWWQLEEMANGLVQQAQQLKQLVEQAKHQSVASKELAIQSMRAQLDKEKSEAMHAMRYEAQINLSRTMMEERAQKDIAVQHALAQARAEMQQDKMDTVTVVSADDKVTYNVTWVPTTQSGQNSIGTIMDEGEEESDKEDKE